MKQLTLSKLNALKFVMEMRMRSNLGEHRTRLVNNDEYGLSILTVSRRNHQVLKKILVANLLPGYECDLLRDNRKLALLEFIEKYNAAVKAAKSKKGDKANVSE